MSPSGGDDAAARLAAIVESSEDAIITTDLLGVITSWNSAAERLYGYPAAQAVGQSIRLIAPPDRQADEEALLQRVQRDDIVRDVDIIRQPQSGTPVTVALTVTAIRGTDGAMVGTVRIGRDMTGRHRAERAARRLAAIVESSDDAIVSKDLNGIVTSWNRAAERMFGYSASEMVGESIRILIPDDRRSEEDDTLARVRSGQKVDHFETLRRRKDGTLIPISLTVSPIRDGSGEVVGASKIARDISERKHAEAEHARLLAFV